MKTSIVGTDLIKHYESLHDGDLTQIGLQPKMDCNEIWTVGWGHALFINDDPVAGPADYPKIHQYFPQFDNLTDSQAEELLKQDLIKTEEIVDERLKISVQQQMYDALISHTYNTGGSSNLFKLINTHAKLPVLEEWWTKHYITSGKVEYKGLIYRRKTEFVLATTGVLTFYNQ